MTSPDSPDRAAPADAPPQALRDRDMDLDLLTDAHGYLLRRAWRDVDRRFQYHFRTVDITAPQYAIMILIDRNAECTPGDLVTPMGISQNNLVRIVGDLIDRGYVSKVMHPHDRRARILTLTDPGRTALAAAHAAHAAYEREYVDRIGADNLRELVRLLNLFDRG